MNDSMTGSSVLVSALLVSSPMVTCGSSRRSSENPFSRNPSPASVSNYSAGTSGTYRRQAGWATVGGSQSGEEPGESADEQGRGQAARGPTLRATGRPTVVLPAGQRPQGLRPRRVLARDPPRGSLPRRTVTQRRLGSGCTGSAGRMTARPPSGPRPGRGRRLRTRFLCPATAAGPGRGRLARAASACPTRRWQRAVALCDPNSRG